VDIIQSKIEGIATCLAGGWTTLQDLDVGKGRGDPPAFSDFRFKPLT
jgi:hypothetical protein